jgi:hypothetical protein
VSLMRRRVREAAVDHQVPREVGISCDT